MTLFQTLHLKFVEEVSSTNDLARQYARKHPDDSSALFVARRQTKGRGLKGRSFHSNLEEGLYASLLLRPTSSNVEDLTLYTVITATAVVQSLAPFVEDPLYIKWVNDIIYKNKKVGGILTEAVYDLEAQKYNGVIIGIGLNLVGSFDEADLQTQQIAGTLFEEKLPKSVTREIILESIVNRIEQLQKSDDWRKVYQSHLYLKDTAITYTQGQTERRGIVRGINSNGQLLVEDLNGKIHTLVSGDVSLRSYQILGGSHEL